MNRYHKKLLSELNYEIRYDEDDVMTDIVNKISEAPLNMRDNTYTSERGGIKISFRDQEPFVINKSLSEEENDKRKTIWRRYSPSDIMDIELKRFGSFFIHAYKRRATGSYTFELIEKSEEKERIILSLTMNNPYSDDSFFYVSINGNNKGINIHQKRCETVFNPLTESQEPKGIELSTRKFKQYVMSFVNEQFQDNNEVNEFIKLMWPVIRLFILDNIIISRRAIDKRIIETSRELAIVQNRYVNLLDNYDKFKPEIAKEKIEAIKKQFIAIDQKITELRRLRKIYPSKVNEDEAKEEQVAVAKSA